MTTDSAVESPLGRGVSPAESHETETCDIHVTVTYSGRTATLVLPADATVEDLSALCEDEFFRPKERSDGQPTDVYLDAHKFLAPPPVGLLYSDRDAATPIVTILKRLHSKAGAATAAAVTAANNQHPLKLRLMASPAKAVQDLREAGAAVQRREQRLRELRQRAVPARRTASANTATSASKYTFQDIKPLPHLPQPERSLAYLYRLRDDVGIRHVMAKHQFTVGLLTEMDPLLYTQSNHEGTTRTLGLNRNQGQVIELRLRTDAGDGYRDYRTVRRTLCHELAHNVFGPHDADFWRLCHQLEREVEKADYNGAGGRTISGESDFYEPASPTNPEHDHTDAGGWTGGTFVLGSGATGASVDSVPSGVPITTVVSSSAAQREQRARAAEERLRRMGGSSSGGGGGSGSGETSGSRDAN